MIETLKNVQEKLNDLQVEVAYGELSNESIVSMIADIKGIVGNAIAHESIAVPKNDTSRVNNCCDDNY